jgi:small-conductance mechanosensitive channel
MQSTVPPEDVCMVIDAAAYLRIGEFDFFKLAWRRWSGEEADEKALERTFVAYMFHQVVPTWARQCAREVLQRVREGRLDRREFGADRVRLREPVGRANPVYVWISAAVFFLFFLVVLTTRYEPATEDPMACELGPGMRTFSEIAYSLSGRDPPDCRPRR